MSCISIVGAATVTASLYLFTILMADYPEVQDKMYQEIRSTLKSKEAEVAIAAISLSDRDKMPYTRAAVLELQRFGSFVPIDLPHMTEKDITIQGVNIPANTAILLNLWELHHDEKFWDAPFKFCPDRFIDDSGDLVPASHPHRKRLLAFGAGPRVCVGQQFALSILGVAVSCLLQNFEIEKPDDSEVISDPRYLESGVTTMPKRQKLKFKSR